MSKVASCFIIIEHYKTEALLTTSSVDEMRWGLIFGLFYKIRGQNSKVTTVKVGDLNLHVNLFH